ncbi:lipid-A-disaccharide synthase [Spongiibacter sp. KMU-158]|uniref:Lipid-A-disaccharide synthase n=1 Tax=Spongiibacter pelagi TaxID=2760804 RepID=A0A927C260_9GAMM|nr:lipid-A-disaccharide synthase [Spongiibacter pelagi]MBD2858266.1 lipid-A-disaccharide synthase [Spongiibacter pelagi]
MGAGHSPKIGMVVGEASGDILGADLMRALKKHYPNAKFEGIGGPLMIAEGFHSLCEMDRLSVMGLVEPLKRLFELLRIRRHVKQHLLHWKADIVIGIDSPDFNLNIEAWLRQRGIKSVHYVSPSVWAWRRGRIKGIARAVDHMLTLFPFEAQFYKDNQVPVTCVGHSLADQIPLEDQREPARRELDIAEGHPVLAILPGSRSTEVGQLIQPFLDAAQQLRRALPNIEFLIPAANEARKKEILKVIEARGGDLPVRVLLGNSRTVMAASDAVLMASGTTSLEALLLQRPMVVAYRFGKWSYAILSRLVKTPYFSLPNLLAKKSLVPELIQDDVCAEVIAPLVLEQLNNTRHRDALVADFQAIHRDLRRNASDRAADVVISLLPKSGTTDA